MTTKTHGPDPLHGPPCCRGIDKVCPEYDGEYEYASICQEHCCCCDPCKTVSTSMAIDLGVTGVCHGHCCKCIPKGFVVKFTPDGEETADCGLNGVILRPASTTALYSVYSGLAPGIGEVHIYVERDTSADLLQKAPPFYEWPGVNPEYYPCQWRLNIPSLYVDQVWRFDGRTISCLHPPAFDPIPDVALGPHCDVPCYGTITIEPYEEDKIPFLKTWEYGDEETVSVDCGICQEVCRTICVKRSIPGQELNANPSERYRLDTFQWDDDSGSWKGGKDTGGGCGTEEITVTNIDGDCYLQIVSLEINSGSFDGDLIAIDPYSCSLGMDVYAEDEDGNSIRISCNPCYCWDYLCGQCRCVCPTLCLLGMDGTTFVHSLLYWDEDIFGWTDGETSVVISSQPGADCGRPTTCKLTMPGWVGESTTGCASSVSIEATNDTAEITAGSLKWRIAFCSESQCRLLGCCEELSDTIYVDFQANENHPAVDYPDIYFLCADSFTTELHLVPGEAGADGQPGFRWIGKSLFVCRDCTGLGSTQYMIMDVEITCRDGASLFRYRVYTPGTDITTMPWTEEISITPPCKVCGIMPDIQLDIQGGLCREFSGLTSGSFVWHATIVE